MKRYNELIESATDTQEWNALKIIILQHLPRKIETNVMYAEIDKAEQWLKNTKPERIYHLMQLGLTFIPCYYGRSQFCQQWGGELAWNGRVRAKDTYDRIELIRKNCKIGIWQAYWIVQMILCMARDSRYFENDFLLFFNEREMANIITSVNQIADEIF